MSHGLGIELTGTVWSDGMTVGQNGVAMVQRTRVTRRKITETIVEDIDDNDETAETSVDAPRRKPAPEPVDTPKQEDSDNPDEDEADEDDDDQNEDEEEDDDDDDDGDDEDDDEDD